MLPLHESGSAVPAVLALDVSGLGRDDRRTRHGAVSWRSRTALLLAGRKRGPVFLAVRRLRPVRPRP